MRKFLRPFRMGDVVMFEGREQIIEEVKVAGDGLIYSTTDQAWIDHDDLVLVRECDEKSMEELRRAFDEANGS